MVIGSGFHSFDYTGYIFLAVIALATLVAAS